jgi:hypothetical protein
MALTIEKASQFVVAKRMLDIWEVLPEPPEAQLIG